MISDVISFFAQTPFFTDELVQMDAQGCFSSHKLRKCCIWGCCESPASQSPASAVGGRAMRRSNPLRFHREDIYQDQPFGL
jgi:hypothetical protein